MLRCYEIAWQAVKFTPKGGQVLRDGKPANGKLEISVKTRGPGIPAGSPGIYF